MPRNLENYRKWKRNKYWENREKEINRKRKYRKTQKGRDTLIMYYNKIKNTEKYKARVKVSSSIRRKKITKKPCEFCGDVNVQAHHDDYSKPLDVRWFCKKHHSEIEREVKPCPLQMAHY